MNIQRKKDRYSDQGPRDEYGNIREVLEDIRRMGKYEKDRKVR